MNMWFLIFTVSLFAIGTVYYFYIVITKIPFNIKSRKEWFLCYIVIIFYCNRYINTDMLHELRTRTSAVWATDEDTLYEQPSALRAVRVDTQQMRITGRTAGAHTIRRFTGQILKQRKTHFWCVLNFAVWCWTDITVRNHGCRWMWNLIHWVWMDASPCIVWSDKRPTVDICCAVARCSTGRVSFDMCFTVAVWYWADIAVWNLRCWAWTMFLDTINSRVRQ